jgi:hypothetical protein
VLAGTFDFKELFDQMIAHHAPVTRGSGQDISSLYFAGLQLGNEPSQGSGSMTIHGFSVTYDGVTY